MLILKKYRYDYFLIWGHGMKYRNEIKRIIDDVPEFKIVMEHNYIAKNISDLVKKVYSYDYAPFYHLKSKTEYLKKTSPKVKFIFIRNKNPIENYFGEGRFLHIECERVKRIKELIRDRFNKRKADRRSEDHVVHASDNESQTDFILKYLGFKKGVKTFEKNMEKIINVPYHLNIPEQYFIKRVSVDELLCSVIENGKIRVMPIEKSPQYQGKRVYRKYLESYEGEYLKDGYSAEKFEHLQNTLQYLQGEYSTAYIITKRFNNKFLILDGLHRAVIQKKRNCKTLKVVVI